MVYVPVGKERERQVKPIILPGDVIMRTPERIPAWLCICNCINDGLQHVVLMNLESGYNGIHTEVYDHTFRGFNLIMRNGILLDIKKQRQL